MLWALTSLNFSAHRFWYYVSYRFFFDDKGAETRPNNERKAFIAAVDEVAIEEGANQLFTYLDGMRFEIMGLGGIIFAACIAQYAPKGVFQKQIDGFKIFRQS
jgi:hypothetical protein